MRIARPLAQRPYSPASDPAGPVMTPEYAKLPMPSQKLGDTQPRQCLEYVQWFAGH